MANSLRHAWNFYASSTRGSAILIVLVLNILIAFFIQFAGISFTNAANKVSDLLAINGNQVISRKSLLFHLHRFAETPRFYLTSQSVFPPKMGRTSILTDSQKTEFISAVKERMTQTGNRFANLLIFSKMAKSMFGFSPSLTTIARLLKQNFIEFGCFHNIKGGTRYHDSDIVVKERVEFLLRKIWYMAWETKRKAFILVHDESWINEKPSTSQYWAFVPPSGKGSINPGKKINGRRLAFSSLYSLRDGLLNGVEQNDLTCLSQSILQFKQSYDSLDDPSITEIFDMASSAQLQIPKHLTISSKDEMILEENGDSGYFAFFCATSKQNRGLSRQMDSTKFLWSIEQMIRNAVKTIDNSTLIVLQLDNATYHRESASDDLISITHPYPPVYSGKSNSSWVSMLDKLKEWNVKPDGASDEWFEPIKTLRRKITANTSPSDKMIIEAHRERIANHKNEIIKTFRMCPNYRYRKTKVEAMMERLSTELDIRIIVLWGARGHSELSEIEFSWSFMKRFAISMNPNSATDSKNILGLSRLLDFSNRQSWRECILVNMECYIQHGYFDRVICRTLQKTKKSIVEHFHKRFEYIVNNFEFSDSGYNEYTQWMSKSIVSQLNYQEILAADQPSS